jgi:hypothetical protein
MRGSKLNVADCLIDDSELVWAQLLEDWTWLVPTAELDKLETGSVN